MITKKTRHVPAKEVEAFDKRVCDVCGKESNDRSNWLGHGYDFCETEVMISRGVRYPECGSSETTTFDICGECFESKLIPFLKSIGAEPTETESDY